VKTIDVNLANRSYPILLASGSIGQIGDFLRERFAPDAPGIVITDGNVARIYAESVEMTIADAGFKVLIYTIEPGEASKRLQTVSSIYDFLVKHKTPRGGIIIGLGGGVVGDVASFVASTYKRGVPYVAVPTSLLAHVDSSVGGKTGIHHGGEKNVIGTFYQPHLVDIDIDTLRTLPTRELLAGMAEVVKCAAALDEKYFSFLERNYQKVLRLHEAPLLHTVSRCCELKAEVVAQDEFDKGVRHVLNYGHTIAHALEASTGFRVFLHGEAVSIGVVAAAKLSRALGRCSDEDVQRQERLLRAIGLPTRLDKAMIPNLIDHLYADKKRIGNKIHFVVCTGIGSTELWPVAPEELMKHLSAL